MGVGAAVCYNKGYRVARTGDPRASITGTEAQVDCRQVNEWLQRLGQKAASDSVRLQIAEHIARCPKCAASPRIDYLLRRPTSGRSSVEASVAPEAASVSETLHALVAKLMVIGAIAALALAAREGLGVANILRAPAEPAPGPVRRVPTPVPTVVGPDPPKEVKARAKASVTSPAPSRPSPRVDTLRAVRDRVIHVLEVDLSDGMALAQLSSRLRSDGALDKVRALRKAADAPGRLHLRQAEVCLLRAAAAQDDVGEWRAIRRLIEGVELVKACQQMLSQAARKGGPGRE